MVVGGFALPGIRHWPAKLSCRRAHACTGPFAPSRSVLAGGCHHCWRRRRPGSTDDWPRDHDGIVGCAASQSRRHGHDGDCMGRVSREFRPSHFAWRKRNPCWRGAPIVAGAWQRHWIRGGCYCRRVLGVGHRQQPDAQSLRRRSSADRHAERIDRRCDQSCVGACAWRAPTVRAGRGGGGPAWLLRLRGESRSVRVGIAPRRSSAHRSLFLGGAFRWRCLGCGATRRHGWLDASDCGRPNGWRRISPCYRAT